MKNRLVLFFFLLPAFAFASTSSLGRKLTEKVWNDIKHKNVHHLKTYLSPEFQTIGFDGVANRSETLKMLSHFPNNIHSFFFTKMTTTRHGNRLVITYAINISATANKAPIQSFGPQLSVWKKESNRWFLVSLADLSIDVK